jgi:hypothetical protein
MTADTIELFRPVGPGELEKIRASGWRAFPPRLHVQPIFYPVLNEEYARQIARDWNAASEKTGYRGFVVRFLIDAEYAARFETHTVGARHHQELWVPADELDALSEAIIGAIEVVAEYRGGPDQPPIEVIE